MLRLAGWRDRLRATISVLLSARLRKRLPYRLEAPTFVVTHHLLTQKLRHVRQLWALYRVVVVRAVVAIFAGSTAGCDFSISTSIFRKQRSKTKI